MDGLVRYHFSANMVAFCFVVIVLCLHSRPTYCNVIQRMKITWKESDYPFVALVSRQMFNYENDEVKNCTGCLVTQDQVVTSAYCTYDQRRNVKFDSFMALNNQFKFDITVRHLIFCNNETQPIFVNRNATSITYMDGYQNDLNRQMAIVNLNPLNRTECIAKTVKIEINRYDSRKVRLVSTGKPKLLVANVSIISLELMQMYYGSLEYGIVFDDGGVLGKTDYAAAILDLKSNNLLGFVIDKNPEILTKSVYKAFYFYPELEEFIKKCIGEYVGQNFAANLTDQSITYDQRLNVNKPENFNYTLSEVKWKDRRYVVQVCNNQTRQICSATLVDNNTLVTTPKCVTQRVPNDTLVVTHFARNRTKEDWELVTRHVTKWWIPQHCPSNVYTGPLNIDYIFMSLSPLDSQDKYELKILNHTQPNLKNKRFHYVRLVSLAWSLTPTISTCNINVNGTMPKLIQLDTIATYNDDYRDNVYDCHIFNETAKNVTIVNYDFSVLNPITRTYGLEYKGYHNGIHNFDQFDYTMLFNENVILLDFESNNLLGLGFKELCTKGVYFKSDCRTEVTKSINVVKAVKYVPHLECPSYPRINVNNNSLGEYKLGDNNFVVTLYNPNLYVYCLGALVTRDKVVVSTTCLKDNLKTLNKTKLRVDHESFLKNIKVNRSRNVTNISYIGSHEQIAILHLTKFENEQLYEIKTVQIEFNRFIPRKIVKFASMSSYGSKDENRTTEYINSRYLYYDYYLNSTEVLTATINIEYSRQLTGRGHQFAIPLNGVHLAFFDLGAPVLDPITGNLLAVISRYEPYSLEPVFIASYFHPDMEARFKELLGNDAMFAHQNPVLESHFIDESLSTKALDVPKPNDFDYILSEVPWINHTYIARICHENTRKICTATLVDTNRAITSSHCLSNIPLEDLTFTQFVKNLNTSEWQSITRSVTNSSIVRHDTCTSLRGRMSVGYSLLQLSPVEGVFVNTTTRNESQPEDQQFRYARLLSVVPSFLLENSSDWSCNSIEYTNDSKLIQLDTLVSLNYEYGNQVYDCPIFASTTLNSTIANRTRLDSLNYILDLNKGFHISNTTDYSLLIADGFALFDYSTDKLLGIGYNELCDDYEEICLLNTIRPINFAKAARLVPYTSQSKSSQDLSWLGILYAVCMFIYSILWYIVIAIVTLICIFTGLHLR